MEKEKNYFLISEKVILFSGIVLIALSFISEFHFHYIQGFMPGNVESDIFWRAEAAEVLNSMSFLIIGIVLVIMSFFLSRRRRNTDKPKSQN
jgi:LPXTG-motif cell wall-anchored protein